MEDRDLLGGLHGRCQCGVAGGGTLTFLRWQVRAGGWGLLSPIPC